MTLLAGAAVAAVFYVADVRATSHHTAVSSSYGKTVVATTSSAAAPTPTQASASATASSATALVHNYGGHVSGRAASLAISVYAGKAIAYVCGGKFEVWLTGAASNGTLTLTGKYGATLTATYDQTTARGTVIGAGHQWTFHIPVIHAQSGLYRAYAKSHQVRATWVVLPDGSQIGSVDDGGDTATANPVGALDLSTLTSTLPDGTAVTAAPLDASGGE